MRLQIRPYVYRDHPGFRLRGTDTHGRQVSIFTRFRDLAERLATAIKTDTMDDAEASIWEEERARLARFEATGR